jgi:hypothetical protein
MKLRCLDLFFIWVTDSKAGLVFMLVLYQVDLQAQARAHRIGQKREVLVLRFETVISPFSLVFYSNYCIKVQ